MVDEAVQLTREQLLQNAAQRPDKYRVVQLRGTASNAGKVPTYYWPVGERLTIRFLSGTPEEQAFVRQVAAEWFAHANLKPVFVEDGPAKVRIRIVKAGTSSYSYVGTTSLSTPASEHTVQLAISGEADEAFRRQVVLHEFGHVLGLPAEEGNPNSEGAIDWPKVYEHFQKVMGMPKATIDNFLRPTPESKELLRGKVFDPASVMMHLEPEFLVASFVDSKRVEGQLSEGDKAFIAKIYPQENPTLVALRQAVAQSGVSVQAQALRRPLATALQADLKFQAAALEDSVTPLDADPIEPPSLPRGLEGAVADELVKTFISLSETEQKKAAPVFGRLYLDARERSRRQSRNKAIYRFDDQYAPATYKTIYERSKSVCYISADRERLGTCFMLGENLVLTCAHTLRKANNDEHDAKLLRVSFGKGADPDEEPAYPVARVVFRGTESSLDGVDMPALDFVLLELGPNDETNRLPSEDDIRPIPIDPNERHELETPVYVIGYPGQHGNKTVADNARIYLGFDSNFEEKVRHELQAHGEAQRLVRQAEEDHKDSDEVIRWGALKVARRSASLLVESVERSLRRGQASPPRYYLLSELVQLPAHPAFALDSDTYHGNSGSPVLSRRSSKVTGVLFRGMDDRKVDLEVGYLQHEEAVPIHLILKNWQANHPEQLNHYKVKL